MRYATMYSAIVKEMGADISYDTKMAAAVELWTNLFQKKAPWNIKDVESAGIAPIVSQKVAKLMTFEVKATLEGSEMLQQHFQRKVMPKLRTQTEYGLAKGSLIIKPLPDVDAGRITTQFIQADMFYPIEFSTDGDLTKCVLVDQIQSGNTVYTRLELHSLEGGKLQIENRAYRSANDETLGTRIPLETVDRWAGLSDEVTYEGIDILPFGLFRCPMANQIETDSPLGVSIYSRAVNHLREADKIYSDFCWEIESKQTAVHMAESMLQYDHQTGAYKAPAGKERLYRALPFSTGAVNQPLIDVYSPDIRSAEYIEALNSVLRLIEDDCSLSHGVLSDPQSVERTAEEVRFSKHETNTMIKDCQRELEFALQDWLKAAVFWCQIYGMDAGNAKLEIDWGDSIINDPDAQFEKDLKMLSAGLMRPEEVRSKHMGEDIETALANLPETEQVMP